MTSRLLVNMPTAKWNKWNRCKMSSTLWGTCFQHVSALVASWLHRWLMLWGSFDPIDPNHSPDFGASAESARLSKALTCTDNHALVRPNHPIAMLILPHGQSNLMFRSKWKCDHVYGAVANFGSGFLQQPNQTKSWSSSHKSMTQDTPQWSILSQPHRAMDGYYFTIVHLQLHLSHVGVSAKASVGQSTWYDWYKYIIFYLIFATFVCVHHSTPILHNH